MSTEALNQHSAEVPSYREMFRHFGRKAIQWALGTNINYTRTVEHPTSYVSTTPHGELSGGNVIPAQWTTSESAKTRQEQLAANVVPVEMRTAPAAGYAIGEIKAPEKTVRPAGQANPAGYVIGGENTQNLQK